MTAKPVTMEDLDAALERDARRYERMQCNICGRPTPAAGVSCGECA